VAPATRIVTLQNGVDSVELLRPILGADQVVGGTVHVATVIAAPGVVRHTSQFAQLRCGRSDRRADPALADFVTAAKAAGIDATLSDDIEADRWKKFVFLVALSGATGAMRLPLGPIRADPDTRAFFVALMRETIAVGQAQGVALPSGFIEDRIGFADRAPHDFKASLLHDLEAGRRLELDWLAGKVTALGRTLGIATPANEAVYAVLKLHRNGRVP
jgi:2-dehydropantoate 2-reductase